MKTDAVIRVPRESWVTVRDFSIAAGRDIREVAGVALEEYVRKQKAAR